MASGKLLRQLIKSGIEGDKEVFRQVSEAVIQEERLKRHALLANDLEKILYGASPASKANHINLKIVEEIPLDKERGLPLLELIQPVRSLENVVMTAENSELAERILFEHNREEILRTWGLRPIERVLFCGPPGCGKTITAEALAYELNRHLCIVRLDSVVSSFLGETSANLRKVFDYIRSIPMVVLFDEFDALAKERSSTTEHGELKRVVNAFLQMLDGYKGPSLIVAATNHEMMLDSAIWRRFEEVLNFPMPTVAKIKELLEMKLRGVRREFEINKAVTDLFKNVSHADIERVLRRAIKDMALSGKEFLNLSMLKKAVDAEKARKTRLNKVSKN